MGCPTMRASLALVALLVSAKPPESPLSCAWGAHACRSCSAHGRSGNNATEASAVELAKMRQFAAGAGKSWWVDLRGDHREQERERFKAMAEWSRAALFPGERSLPAVSLFGGADLAHLDALFEGAPSLAIVDELPVGDGRCFLSPKCFKRAGNAVQRWYTRLHSTGFRSLSTEDARDYFSEVGVLPALLLALELRARQRVVGASFWDDGERSGVVLDLAKKATTAGWACSRVEYVSADLSGAGALASAANAIAAPRPWAGLLKATPPADFFPSLPEHFAVLVGDLGSSPAYGDARWAHRPFGAFGNSTEERAYAADADGAARLFSEPRPSLGFCFGDCAASPDGALVVSSTLANETDRGRSLWVVLGARPLEVETLARSLDSLPGVAFSKNATAPGAARDGAAARGFPLVWSDIGDRGATARDLRAAGASAIHVFRRDPVLNLVESLEAPPVARELIYDVRDRHAIGLTKGRAPPPVPIAPDAAVAFSRAAKRDERHARCWSDAWAARTVHVAYEDLIKDHATVQRDLAALLGLEGYAPTAATRAEAGRIEQLRLAERPCQLRIAAYSAVAAALGAAGHHGCDECRNGGGF